MRSILSIAALLGSAEAFACGGFFCDNVAPVDQAAERIVFAIDDVAEVVEVHVQISYEGDASEFAWVVPVPEEPELFTSVDDLFTRLSPLTMPRFNLNFETEGECRSNGGRGGILTADAGAESDDADFGEEAPEDGVSVVSKAVVGPYDTVVLQADGSEALLTWLQDNGYDLPDDLSPKLDPYVQGGAYFVALRLTKGNDAGDLVPLGMRYAGTEPQIPLQLTAVAATPDMRLQPFVLGRHRAVPENYYHVTINPLSIDWFQAGANYPDVITEAANIAGGRAFATDFSGPARAFDEAFWSPGLYDVDRIRPYTDPLRVVEAMQFEANVPVSTGTAPILQRFLPVPEEVLADGVTAVQFYQCIDCWLSGPELDALVLDGEALADALRDDWVAPMRHAQELFDGVDVVTRLTSSISADEMEVDPLFVLNAELDDVPQDRNATLVTDCTVGNPTWEDAPRRLDVEGGPSVYLPAEAQFGFTPDDLRAWIGDDAAQAVNQVQTTGRSGAPIVVTDNTPDIQAAVDASNEAFLAAYGCGCATGGPGGGLLAGLLGLGAVVGRRRGARS